MRVFWEELKKVMNWKLLLAIFLFSLMYYKMFISYHMNMEYCDPYALGTIKTSGVLLKKYGTTVSPDELKDFEKNYVAKAKMALNQKIAGLEDFRKAKITDADQLDNVNDGTEKGNALYEKLVEELDNAGSSGRLETPEERDGPYILYICARNEADSLSVYPEQVKQLKTGGIESRKEQTVLPQLVSSAWSGLARDFAVLLLVTSALIAAPCLVRENRANVKGLAYSAKKGRKLFTVQFAAVLAGALLAVLAQAAGFFALYIFGCHKVDQQFWNCYMYNIAAYPETFGQYIAADAVTTLFFALGMALLSFAVSKLCRNYVSLMAAEVPLLFLVGRLSVWSLQNSFETKRMAACAAAFLIPMAVCLFLLHREKTTDMV
jgi:hypothetical protein